MHITWVTNLAVSFLVTSPEDTFKVAWLPTEVSYYKPSHILTVKLISSVDIIEKFVQYFTTRSPALGGNKLY